MDGPTTTKQNKNDGCEEEFLQAFILTVFIDWCQKESVTENGGNSSPKKNHEEHAVY